MIHVNLFASFLLFSTLQLIKETFMILSVGFPKDVLRENLSINKVSMNPNVSVSASLLFDCEYNI